MNMRILMVNTGVFPLPPETAAGTEYYIYYLSNELAKLGHEVHLITEVKNSKAFHPNVYLHSFRMKHLLPRGSFSSWLLQHALGGFHAYIKTLQALTSISKPFDVIHIHGRLAARLITMTPLKSPLIYTLHDQSPWLAGYKGIESFLRKAAYLILEAKIVRKVNHVIVVSQTIYNEVVHWLRIPSGKVTIIPCGVDTRYFKSAEKKPYILFVGRLTRRKRVDSLLRAYARLPNREYQLLIVGDGEERLKLIELTRKLGIRDRVIFLANISRQKLRQLYAHASIFILPSIGEGLPLSLLEAMASGCGVVATRVSGVTDVVKHDITGLLVKPGNEQDLYQKMSELLNDEEKIRILGDNARKYVMKRYEWSSIARKVLRVYEYCLIS